MGHLLLCRHWRAALAAFCLSAALLTTFLHPHPALQGIFSAATAPATDHNHQTASAASATNSNAQTPVQQPQRSFIIDNDQFMRDGQPFQILSGSIHYHRIPPDLWLDRLQRMKAMGLNAVQVRVTHTMSNRAWVAALVTAIAYGNCGDRTDLQHRQRDVSALLQREEFSEPAMSALVYAQRLNLLLEVIAKVCHVHISSMHICFSSDMRVHG